MTTYTRWTRIERMTRSWSQMADAQLVDEVLNQLNERRGLNDANLEKYLTRYGVEYNRALMAIATARETLRATKSNPARLQRSVGSDSYVDGQTRRSTI
jgi:hypothetical protein